MGDRARRRGVHINPPPRSDVQVQLDPVVVQLTVHRMLFSLIETLKKTDLRLEVESGDGDSVDVTACVADGAQVPADYLKRPPAPPTHGGQPQPLAVAINLAVQLADLLGGSLSRQDGPEGSAIIRLRLPTGQPTAE